MVQTHYAHQSAQSVDFSMKTSSGDSINLSAFKESKIDFQSRVEEGLKNTVLSIREKYGMSFSYRGNGLDKQDIQEINDALKEIKPMLSFLQPNSGFFASDKNIADKAMDINALLPTTKDENHANYLKDSLVTMLDEMLESFDANDKILALAKDVFTALEKQMDGLMLYA